MKTGFIGAGKVGCSLGKYFSLNGIGLSGFYSRSSSSSRSAAELTGALAFSSLEELVSASDTIFITVPDSAIKNVYDQLTKVGISGKTLCHCSGAMTVSEAFPDIAEYGAEGCSVHPLFPVSSRTDSYKELHNAFFCIEGNSSAAAQWQDRLRSIGNQARMISGSCKSSYHAACAIMSNLVCGLAQTSLELMKSCGFTESESLAALRPLAENNIGNIFTAGPSAALTGPVERCDTGTVQKHLQCISDSTDRELYKSVSRKLVDMAQQRHPDTDYQQLREILE